MSTVLEVLELTTDYLAKRGFERARRDGEDVLCTALGLPRLELYLLYDRPLADEELERCREVLLRRSKHEPIQYIQGTVEFFGCELRVTSDVLIPRSETEQLVDQLAGQLRGDEEVWDICCGSGCIGIALKKKYPELKVVLSDISERALALAVENAQLNDVSVDFIQGDLLAPFEGRTADVIVSNPPYVTEEEYAILPPEVAQFEPKLALVGGTDFYERFARELPNYLNQHGKAFFEIGAMQGESVKQLFEKGPWKSLSVDVDYTSRDRFFSLEKE